MWYFTWILRLLLACSLGILHILRFEAQETFEKEHVPLDLLNARVHQRRDDNALTRKSTKFTAQQLSVFYHYHELGTVY